MTIIFEKKPESGAWNLARNEVIHEYTLLGTDGEFPDEVAVAVWLDSNVPLLVEGAWIQDIQIEPQGPGFFYVTLPYGPLPKLSGFGAPLRINFRTTGGTVHISASRGMIAKYDTAPVGPPAKETVIIGENGSGAEITVPTQMRSYTFNFRSGNVNEALMDYWEDLTGAVNLIPWRGRPAGEVLFLGAEGDTTVAAGSNSSVTFHFAMNRNAINQTIGDISGIAKQGHDLIDIRTMTNVIDGQDVQKEKFVYIQRVYNRLDFKTYLGF